MTTLLQSAVAGGIPGLVAVTGRGPAVLRRWVAGQADTSPDQPMHIGTIFDLASLTKVVATTTATLALVGQGALALDDAVIGFLPRFEACRAGPVTVRHLLTHTSGLPQPQVPPLVPVRRRDPPGAVPDPARGPARLPRRLLRPGIHGAR